MSAALSQEGLVAWLRDVSLFKSLGDDAVKQVAEQARWRSFPKDTLIIQEGKTGNTMYVIREGEVSVRRSTRHAVNVGNVKNEDDDINTSNVSVDVELAKIKVNGYFGELALLNPKNLRIADVIAVADCKCLEINRNTFCEIINPTVKLTAVSQERSYEVQRAAYDKWRAHKLADDRKRQRAAARSQSLDMRAMPNVGGNPRNRGLQRKGSLAQRSSIGRHSLALDELFATEDGKIKPKPKASRRESALTKISEAEPTT